MSTDYVDTLEEDDDLEGKTRFTFKTIKGKPNKNPADFAMIWNDECPEVQFEGRTCLRIRTGSPVEFRALSDFCHNFFGRLSLQESVRLYSEERACSAAKAEEKEEESFQRRLN